MRGNEKIKNTQDDRINVERPVILITAALIAIVGIFVWLGIRNPVIFSTVRDFLITFSALLFFIISTALAVLCFFLASRINDAKVKLDEVLTTADGKVEELGGKVEEILKKILEPVIKAESRSAGILHIFSKRKTEKS